MVAKKKGSPVGRKMQPNIYLFQLYKITGHWIQSKDGKEGEEGQVPRWQWCSTE